MRSETRINLIVLAIVLALVLPGGVILFRKKSQPGERAIGSPDPVRTTTAWMDPNPADNVTRLAPLKALQWTGYLATDGFAGQLVLRPTSQPSITGLTPTRTPGNVGEAVFYGQNHAGSADTQVMSDHRWFQVIARGGKGNRTLRLIVWDEDRLPETGVFSSPLGRITTAYTELMPTPIRHDLQESGFVLPPVQVSILDLVLNDPNPTTIPLTFTPSTARKLTPKSDQATLP